jgi:hypothetical protein
LLTFHNNHEVDVPKTPPDHAAHPAGGGVVWPGEADARGRRAVRARRRQPARPLGRHRVEFPVSTRGGVGAKRPDESLTIDLVNTR